MRKMITALVLLATAACADDNAGPTGKEGEYNAQAIDGDTFIAGEWHNQSWRLARIDAAELPGHCRPGRDCVKGDPYVATAVLRALLAERPIRCKLIATDVYGRNIGECYNAKGKNLSDEMLRLGVAEEYRR